MPTVPVPPMALKVLHDPGSKLENLHIRINIVRHKTKVCSKIVLRQSSQPVPIDGLIYFLRLLKFFKARTYF